MKKLWLLTLFLFCYFLSEANIITVTSNADNGAGSLREAITLANANGFSIPDTIVFNIPGTTDAERTIIIQSQLPSLSSNLTIDGTTQPGNALGLSNAKLILLYNQRVFNQFTLLYIQDASNVNVYGICFQYTGGSTLDWTFAVGMRRSSEITIGAAGKGNLFSSVSTSIANFYPSASLDSIRNLVEL